MVGGCYFGALTILEASRGRYAEILALFPPLPASGRHEVNTFCHMLPLSCYRSEGKATKQAAMG